MRIARIAGVVVVAAVVGFALARWLAPGRGAAPLATAPAAPAAPAAAGAPAVPETPVSPLGDLRIASNGRIAIDAAAIDPGRPVVLQLDLGVPSRSADPRPVRIASTDGRVLEAQGSLGGARQQARVEVDPAFLSRPGLYLVEVKTAEQTPLPLRRYVIEVR